VAGRVTLELVGQLGGAAATAALQGEQLFVGSGSQVVEVDLTDARSPRDVAFSEPLPGTVEDVDSAGELLAVAVGDGGVAILDPGNGLSLRSSLTLPGYAEAVAVGGSVAHVADGPGGLRLVDLRDPATPVEIASLFDLHRIVDVAVGGGRAYVAAADEGLLVVDVSDPTAPKELGRLFTGGYAFGVATDGNRVLLADGWGGLRVIDATNPKAPRLVATVPTAAWAMGVEIDTGRAYVAAGSDLRILDLADPKNPEEVGSVPLPGGHAVGVSVSGDGAVVVDDTAGIRILDVGLPTPAELSIYAPLAPSNGLAILGDRVFLAAKRQGLRVVDISDPERPTEVPGIHTADLVNGAAAVGSNLFFTTFPGPGSRWTHSIFGLDATVDGPLAPGPPFLNPGNNTAMFVDGSTLLIADELGLWLVDGSDPSPCELAYLETQVFLGEGFESNGVTVAGGLAYVSTYYGKIRIVDVSDPRAPRVLDQATDGAVGVGKVLSARGSLYAIAADELGRPVLAVFDLSVPTAPELVGLTPLPGDTARGDEVGPQLAYAGGRLFVADGASGLLVIDVSNPSRPEIAGRLRLPGETVGVVVQREHAYVASDGGGLFVVSWSPGDSASLPTDSASSSDTRRERIVDRGVLAAFRQPSPDSSSDPLAASSCLVTSTDDSGPGSLRGCLEQPQSGAVITFDPAVFPPDRPATINVRGTPLAVGDQITIDGGGAGVVIDGGGAVDEGLHVGSETTIRNLTITGFAKLGMYVDGSSNTIAKNVVSANGDQGIALYGPDNRVVGNLIGLDPSGTKLWGAQAVGLSVVDTGNVVGGPEPADRNVISGSAIGIYGKGTLGATIQGNYVNTDVRGEVMLRSRDVSTAILLDTGATANRVVDNVVAGDIQIIDPGSSYNAILGNLVGVDATGRRLFGEGSGIIISEPFNQVGGTLPGEGNVVGGITIGATDVVVLGNLLGVDERGNPLGGDDSIIRSEKRRAIIGGRSPGAANVIVGVGVEIRADSNVVIGNRIRGAPGLEAYALGIRIANASRNHVVANVIERGGVGIGLDEGAYGNVIRGNVVRRNPLGLLAAASSERNVITGNAFVGNRTQARDKGGANVWDDGRRGNYWSDLEGPDADGDGALDRPRAVEPEGVDRFPLAQPP
jgi:parallel beta-helix repeat protein